MNVTTVRTRLVLVLAPLLLAVLGATSSALACVVGNGTMGSCTESPLNDCLPGGIGFDGTVTFACGGIATINVTTTKLINVDTTIDGGTINGAPLTTITGGGTAGLFFMSAPFTVKNLGIGDASGDGAIVPLGSSTAPLTVMNCGFFGNTVAIETFDTVTVSDSTFSNNTVVAIIAGSGTTVMVDNSSFLGNPGGINAGGAGGTVTVNNSTFSGNNGASGTGGNGAAINSGGSLTVMNSTFSDNTATNNGGAIYAAGPTTVSNSTFFGNRASSTGGGGAIDVVGGGSLSVINCTFDGNGAHAGAAINAASTGPVTAVNSILAQALIGLGLGGNCSGTVTDDGHNIDDGTTCGFTGTGCATTTGTSFCNTNPQLGPLADNGGPTQTMALEAGSPAINAGDETVCAAPPVNNRDQRGFVRPGAGATNCSIGTYEFNAVRCGDVNGDGVVNIGDALLVAQFDVGLRQCGVTPFNHAEVCDVNRDSACNIGDALRMAQCDVGLISCAFSCGSFACPSTTSTTSSTTTQAPTTTTSTTTTTTLPACRTARMATFCTCPNGATCIFQGVACGGGPESCAAADAECTAVCNGNGGPGDCPTTPCIDQCTGQPCQDTTTTTLPPCVSASISCTCGNGFHITCSGAGCSPVSCADRRALCVSDCTSLGGPGDCPTAPCNECATGAPCDGGSTTSTTTTSSTTTTTTSTTCCCPRD